MDSIWTMINFIYYYIKLIYNIQINFVCACGRACVCELLSFKQCIQEKFLITFIFKPYEGLTFTFTFRFSEEF